MSSYAGGCREVELFWPRPLSPSVLKIKKNVKYKKKIKDKSEADWKPEETWKTSKMFKGPVGYA